MIKTANFPASVWDGLTNFREDRRTNSAPDSEDWDEMTAELLAIATSLVGLAADTIVWVAPWGVAATATGSMTNPYKTITAALAATTSLKKTVCLHPGTYTLAAAVDIPGTLSGLKIIGIGGSEVTKVDQAADFNAFEYTPAQAALRVLTIQGIEVLQYAGKVGLAVDDTGHSVAGITVNLNDVKLTMDTTGDSIDTVHAVAIPVILNMVDCVCTGLVDIDIINAGDRVNVDRSDLGTAGVTLSAGAVAAATTFKHSVLKNGGDMTSAAEQSINSIYCSCEDYSLVASADLSGATATENIVGS